MAARGTGLSDARSARHRSPRCHSTTAATTPKSSTGIFVRGSQRTATRAARPMGARRPVPRAPSGTNAGSTWRVVSAAATSPATENTPSCASPGKPENTSATKPHTEVSSPSRTVGQLPRTQACQPPRPCSSRRAWIR